jgi:hypothetical protein
LAARSRTLLREFSQADPVSPFCHACSEVGQKLSEILRPYRERYFLTGG